MRALITIRIITSEPKILRLVVSLVIDWLVICTFTLKSENDIPVLFAFEPEDTTCILTKLRLQSQSRWFPAMSIKTFPGVFFLSVELRSSGNDAIRLKLGRKCHKLHQWCHCHKIWRSKWHIKYFVYQWKLRHFPNVNMLHTRQQR